MSNCCNNGLTRREDHCKHDGRANLKQAGGSDCSLFAIAFATALVNGKQPGKPTDI